MTTNSPIYQQDYFTYSQCFLYIGDTWIDEITSLAYNTVQNKTPIFGYASQLFDDTAAGQVFVQGNFTINYKEAGYLWAVLRRYKQLNNDAMGIGTPEDAKLLGVKMGSTQTQPDLTDKRYQRVGSNGTIIDRRSIEDIAQGRATTGQMYEFYEGFTGYSTTRARKRVLEDIVEAFEDQIWNPTVTNTQLNSQSRRTDDNKFDNFDMYVLFGNYGDPNAEHTVQKIIGVRLISQGKSIQMDGVPIQESYSFIAQSVC